MVSGVGLGSSSCTETMLVQLAAQWFGAGRWVWDTPPWGCGQGLGPEDR